jgi:Ergosterol biosynthesis ERG4/ERG24 family
VFHLPTAIVLYSSQTIPLQNTDGPSTTTSPSTSSSLARITSGTQPTAKRTGSDSKWPEPSSTERRSLNSPGERLRTLKSFIRKRVLFWLTDGVCTPFFHGAECVDKYLGRKIHYTMDVVMALCWGLSCGFSSFLPYWYPVWMAIVILQRAPRDIRRCREKYGEVT